MPRKDNIKEWFGKNDDAKPPPSVRRRITVDADSCCQACGNRVRVNGQIDHRVALINGGENRESNLQFLCKPCHGLKTGADVAEKSKSHKKQIHLGPLRKRKSYWSQNYAKMKERYKYDWNLRRYVPRDET